MITSDVKDLAFSDQTIELTNDKGEVLAAKVLELDLEKLIEESKDNPQTLKAVIDKYIEDSEYSTISLVLSLDVANNTWFVFEGLCNLKRHKFKVVKHITTFPANERDPRRPPTTALNFISSAAVARGVSCWIP